MKRILLALAIAAAFVLSACTDAGQSDTSVTTSTPTPTPIIAVTSTPHTQMPATTTQIPAPTTTKKSGAAMPAHFCSFRHYSGATYYVQYLYGQSGSASDLGICTAGTPLTQAQFTDMKLTRECVLSDEISIKQKRGIISYYSDGSATGAAAVQDFCK